MTPFWIFAALLITATKWLVQDAVAQSLPPEVKGSYRALGEIVEALPEDPSFVIQASFEENYDDEEQMASFTVREARQNTTFIQNFRTNQTLQYIENTQCQVITPEDWREIEAPPSFLGYQVKNDRIQFPLQQLFNIDREMFTSYNSNSEFRGIPARKWTYEMKHTEEGKSVTITLYAYWTVPGWKSTSSADEIPLGYEITKLTREGTTTTSKAQFVSVFGFVHQAVDKRVFEHKAGLICPNRTGTYKFPPLPKMDAVSLRSEYVLPDFQDIRNIEINYDMKNYLLRVDSDRLDDQQPMYMKQGRKMTSEITSKMLGVTFVSTIYEGLLTCDVIPIEEYKFEAQNLINPKLEGKKWNVGSFFGVNTTNHVYVGKTTKRNIPCHIFQAIRTDWPEVDANVTSIWEWCFAIPLSQNDEKVEFRDGEYPLINAFVNITESSDRQFPVGFRMVHHFYDIVAEDPNALSSTAFELTWCIPKMERIDLQFTVDVQIDKENTVVLENATSDPSFLSAWKSEISLNSGIPLYALRIAQVRSIIYNEILNVMFTLLDIEPKLPDSVKEKMIPLNESYSMLRKAVDDGKVSINYFSAPGKKPLILKAKENSLTEQVDPTTLVQVTTTEPVITTTESTIPPFNFSLVTPRQKTTPTSGNTTEDNKSPLPGNTTESPLPENTTESLLPGNTTESPLPGNTTESPLPGKTTPDKDGTTSHEVVPTASGLEGEEGDYKGASSGTVAAVTIVMLMLGITIGSGGTFYKLRGLPVWLRK